MRIGIATKPGLADATQTLAELERWLRGRADAVWSVEAAALLPTGARQVVERDDLPARVELVVVLGGDGTLLALADQIARSGRDIPVLGVNLGSLGFLTEITRPELFASLDAVLSGAATHDVRMMLRAVISRRAIPEPPAPSDLGSSGPSAALSGPSGPAEPAGLQVPLRSSAPFAARGAPSAASAAYVALNDIVFTRTALSRMIELDVSVGDQFVATIKADGLIVASPTGSTAYNLSAGGPIVHPAMDALVLTPIAPHALTNRPIVIPAERDVHVSPSGAGAGDVYVTFDGQSGFPLQAGDEVAIGRAAQPLRLVRASARSYFEVLRQKLKWNER